MFDFFFYGTLLDPEIRRLVLRREVVPGDIAPAALAGYRRYTVRNAPYPAAVRERGAEIAGIIVRGLGVRDAARLSNFEGDDYVAALCPVKSTEVKPGEERPQQAWVFIATERVPLTKSAWSLDRWRVAHKGRFLEIAQGWLGARGDEKVAVHERIWRGRLQAGQS